MYHLDHRISAVRLLVVLLTMMVSLTPALRAWADEEDEQVEEFLSRLGLVDLQILHLENGVANTKAEQPRLALGRRLADLYAARLMSLGDDKKRYDDVLARIRRLVEDMPQANTTSLQVMLLQADYSRAEAQITKWIEDRSKTAALKDANEILARIAPQLHSHQKELNEDLEKLNLDLDAIEDPVKRAAAEQEIKRRASVVGRATYFTGWANYYHALGKQNFEASKEELDHAKNAFRRFLGLDTDEKYEEIEPGQIQALESLNGAQSLIGLGLAELASSNLEGARHCFRLLDHVGTPPAIRDQAATFFLQGLLNAGLVGDAADYAAEQVAKFDGGATQGKVSFCVALLRAGFGGGDAMSAEHQRLRSLGVRGLARLRQMGIAQKVLADYDVDLDDAKDFYFVWLNGHRLFSEAEKSKSKADYETASEKLLAALKTRRRPQRHCLGRTVPQYLGLVPLPPGPLRRGRRAV